MAIMPRLFLLFSFMILIVLQNIPTARGDSADNGVKVAKSSLILDSKYHPHILGEVINRGRTSVDNVFVVAVLYNEETSIASNYAFVQTDNIRPGEKSGFEIVVEDVVDSGETRKFDRYELFVTSSQAGPKFACLSLLVTETFLDNRGRYHLSGTVANNGNEATDSIKVAATFYNSTGHVTAINATNLVVDDKAVVLEPNNNGAFNLIGIPLRGSAISSYSISVESRHYSMVNPAVTRENVQCLSEQSTSLTLEISSSTSDQFSENLTVNGSVAVQIESEEYVILEIYNKDGKMYYKGSCKLSNDNSYLCDINFYHLDEHEFMLRARYADAFTETSFVRLSNNVKDVNLEENGLFGSIIQYSKIGLNDGEFLVARNSSYEINTTDPVLAGSIPRVSKIDLETTVTNENPTNTFLPMSLIVQITNDDGMTVFLRSYSIILDKQESLSLRTDWKSASEGIMTINIFVWDNIDRNPIPLAQANRLQVFLIDYLFLDNSLKAYWDFENLINDKTGNHNEAEAYSGIDFVSGFKGQAAEFEAINGDYVKIPDSTTIDVCVADCTATAWIKLASTGERYGIIGNHYGGGENGWIMIIKENANILSFWSKPSEGTETFVDGNTALSADTWYFIAVTRSGDTVTLYVNGLVDATGTVSGDLTRMSSPFFIGALREDSNNFDGIIDQVTLHDRALSFDEISRLYNEG